MEGYDASTYGERWADVYDDWYGDDADLPTMVEFLAGLASPTAGDESPPRGPIIELGIGTGLIALPLAAKGLDVRGIDSSPAMVAHLKAKPGGAAIPITIGDMADVIVPAPDAGDGGARAASDGSCQGVYAAFNTFFGLPSDEDQRRCLAHIRARLAPGGWLVIAAFVPDREQLRGTRSTVGLRSMTADQVVLTADRVDVGRQTISGQFVDISADGIALRPFHLHYQQPEQLDALAAAAGLRLENRFAGWDHAPFDDRATMHVSVYRR
jgi:SAM-dependent methyltransferase